MVKHTSTAPIELFLQALSSGSNAYLSLPIILASAYLFRLVIGLGPFSGQGIGPLHGDFEAQRHWLELTQHLPLRDWYHYDLQYWGLDYPPLTAFHSWALGRIGSILNKEWFALETSRASEDYGLIVYMRQTVIWSELVTYIPAVILFSSLFTLSTLQRTTNILLLLLQPALLLIDHGHFQYNSVMLGLLVYSLYFTIRGQLQLGAIFFVLCLSFKQMGLYYAPVIFSFLLSKVYLDIKAFLLVAVTTAATFAACFAPFLLQGGVPGLEQVIIRMFPFGRGLFEDKVANFWCALNVIYKLKSALDTSTLQKLSLICTLLSVIPGSILVFLRPTPRNLVLGTANSAWGFFLFSFQVHEKTVLLPLIPSSLLIFGPRDFRPWVGWINILATFSMWPLLKKDRLELQYFVFLSFWIWLGGFWRLPQGVGVTNRLIRMMHVFTYIGMISLHIMEPFVSIEGKPDLWPVMNVLLCAPLFGVFYLWTLYQLTQESLILQG